MEKHLRVYKARSHVVFDRARCLAVNIIAPWVLDGLTLSRTDSIINVCQVRLRVVQSSSYYNAISCCCWYDVQQCNERLAKQHHTVPL